MESAAYYLTLIDPRWRKGGQSADAGERHDEYGDILLLLLEGAGNRTAQTVALAECVARACLGEDHLWHDLGLPSRSELSALLHDHFPGLAERNSGNMRWKKFFYKQLCERLEVTACRAPSCGVCCHYQECFDGEETPLQRLGA